jgi:glutaredoxin
MKGLFLLMCLLMLTNLQAAELYRSIDQDGKVHYSDYPLQGTEDVERLKVDKEPISEENLPYETQRAMQNFPVTLYTFPDCGSACQKAREMLNKRGIPFTEKSLTTKEDIEAFRKDSGGGQAPAVTIGKTWLKGFLEEQWNNELDFAGYPKKNLTYRPPVPASAPAEPTQ